MARESPARILVVEDEPDAREILRMTLSNAGHQVDEADCAEEAARLLDARHYDLLVSDWDLPGEPGSTLATHPKASRAGIPVLIVTAHPDPTGVHGLDVLTKPLDPAVFQAQVDRLLGRPDGPERSPPAGPPGEFVLYVTGDSALSRRALRNMESALERFDPASVRFTVCDLAKDPLGGEADGVLFSPTLVKRRPAPRCWLLGDLSNLKALGELLAACGARAR